MAKINPIITGVRIVKPANILEKLEVPFIKDIWQYIVLHHTVNPDGLWNNWKNEKETRVLFGKDINISHYNIKKYRNGMGYHFLINPNGVIECGPRWIYQLNGAHTLVDKKIPGVSKYDINKAGIGICLVGNFDKYDPLAKQLESLYTLLSNIYKITDLTAKNLYPHNYFTKKTCPGIKFPIDKVKSNSVNVSIDPDIHRTLEISGILMDKDNLMKPITKLEVYELLNKILLSRKDKQK